MWREILGLDKKSNGLLELITPRRGFSEVVLPPETRQQLYEALTQIEKHGLIFNQWGLGERHPTGLGLAFNFAGPPGTGKTICAEAVAYTLGRKLLRVNYSELESCWVGETGKNIRSVFREARTAGAVLFFDEADSVAGRRFSEVRAGHEREANQSVNILLKELEEHEGVVIFATNMASNFDPAFERRIRTHILFRIPSVSERERIWRVQIHPEKTPLDAGVDFRELAERFEVSGGDIRNAVLKAAQMAAAEEGPDPEKKIAQKHFTQAMEQVLTAKSVMQQNAVEPDDEETGWQTVLDGIADRFRSLQEEVDDCRQELRRLGEGQSALDTRLHARIEQLGVSLEGIAAESRSASEERVSLQESVESLRQELAQVGDGQRGAVQRWQAEQQSLVERLAEQERRVARATLIPFSRAVTASALAILAVLLVLAGGFGAHWVR